MMAEVASMGKMQHACAFERQAFWARVIQTAEDRGMKKLIAAIAFAAIFGGIAMPTLADQSEQPDLVDWCFMQCIAQGTGNLSDCMHRCIAGSQYLEEMKGESVLRLPTLPIPVELCDPCGDDWPEGCNWHCGVPE